MSAMLGETKNEQQATAIDLMRERRRD